MKHDAICHLRFVFGCIVLLLAVLVLTVGFDTKTCAEETTASDSDPGPAAIHGQLRVSPEGYVVDEGGAAFQLKGISTHNPVWFPEYYNKETMLELRDSFNVNTVRLAMYTGEDGGYAVSDDSRRESTKSMVYQCIDAAIELDLYVIVDWHILSDGNPNTYKNEAISFFNQVSSDYGDSPNIIYEICNEPNSGTSWEDIKAYSADVINTIRSHSPGSIIIVGTPTWSQDVDIAALSPLNDSNLLYSLHFYAATHKDELRARLESAVSAGLPVIVSEFGISEASGSGMIDTASADAWISLLDSYGIGYIYWNLSNKDESSALLISSCTKTYGWSYDELTPAGQWFYDLMNGIGLRTGKASGAAPSAAHAYSSDSTWLFSNDCTVSVTDNGTWSDGTYEYASYDVNVANNGSASLSGWRLRFTWSSDIMPKEYWSCEIGGSGCSRLFVPVDYNSAIPAGSSVQFGMIVYAADVPALTNVSFE